MSLLQVKIGIRWHN